MKITIYTREDPPCPYCEGAKLVCSTKGYDFNTIVIGRDIQKEEFLEMYPGQRTVPLVMVTEDGFTEKIGGYAEFKTWAAKRDVKGMTL